MYPNRGLPRDGINRVGKAPYTSPKIFGGQEDPKKLTRAQQHEKHNQTVRNLINANCVISSKTQKINQKAVAKSNIIHKAHKNTQHKRHDVNRHIYQKTKNEEQSRRKPRLPPRRE